MLSFYPGPSKLYPQVYEFMQDAIDDGVFSLNHRSGEFTEIIKKAVIGLRDRLDIPESYQIYFVSSATECWEIIAQSFIVDDSYHIYNGAFGQKWYDYTKKLHPNTRHFEFGIDDTLVYNDMDGVDSAKVLCLTHSETSNGTMLSNQFLSDLRKNAPDALIALDATSSMAGIQVDFSKADIWYASVQKCFGLPAGMGIMVCSPKAQKKGIEIGEEKHYNSFTNLHLNAEKFQTTHTPNTLNIYLLSKLMPSIPHISDIDSEINERAESWYEYLSDFQDVRLLVKNSSNRSQTVIAIEAELEVLNNIKLKAREENILLGRGYGQWLNQSFRLANFPAINSHEIDILKTFLEHTIN